MKNVLRTVVVAGSLLIFVSPLAANAEIKPIPGFDYVEALFPGCTPKRCVIKGSMGGYIMPFETAKKQMVERNILVVIIDGICNSMCARIMDEIQKDGVRVYMTARGEFGFHKQRMFKVDEHDDLILDEAGNRIFDHWEEPVQSAKVQAWIESKGGAPISDSYKTNLHLKAKEAATKGLFAMWPPSKRLASHRRG